MNAGRNRADGLRSDRRGVRFGGWSDYREWAAHDFRPRTPADQPGGRIAVLPAVDRLIELAPITVPEQTARTFCQIVPPPEPEPEAELDFNEFVDIDEGNPVRPYVRAGGRAETSHQLEFETVLSATGLHRDWTGPRELTDDQWRICAECESPRSVAEISAGIAAPIGVTMVLIGDAIDAGLLMVHERTPDVDGRPSLELLKRLHGGISNLA